MATKDQKFYWLKLKAEFMNGEIIDFLMSQKNGANYVVLYEMLCVRTINTQGELATKIGDILIPFNIEKIERECKWFDRDTIIVAMELYKKLGLLYEQENGIIKISEFEQLVGSETYWAKQKREQRLNNGVLEGSGQTLDNVHDNVQNPLISLSNNLKDNYINNNTNIVLAREEEEKPFKPEEYQAFIQQYEIIDMPMVGGTLCGMDFKKISEAYAKSKWLRTHKQAKYLKFISTHYNEIITGYYEDDDGNDSGGDSKPKPKGVWDDDLDNLGRID